MSGTDTTLAPSGLRSIAITANRFKTLSNETEIYPSVPHLIASVLWTLAEEAVKPDGGKDLSSYEISQLTGIDNDKINAALQRLPGLLAIYAADTGLQVSRLYTGAITNVRKVKTPSYRLTYTSPKS